MIILYRCFASTSNYGMEFKEKLKKVKPPQ